MTEIEQGRERFQRNNRYEQSDHTAEKREQEAFAEQLSGNLPAGGPKRGSHGHLALASRGSGKKQIRYVGAGHQQYKSHCDEQNDQRRTGVPE